VLCPPALGVVAVTAEWIGRELKTQAARQCSLRCGAEALAALADALQIRLALEQISGGGQRPFSNSSLEGDEHNGFPPL